MTCPPKPKLSRQSSTANYRSQTQSSGGSVNITQSSSDEIDFDFNAWEDIQYKSEDLKINDRVNHNNNYELRFGTIGDQQFNHTYNKPYDNNIHMVHIPPKNNDEEHNDIPLLEHFIHGTHIPIFYFDLWALIKIGNDELFVSFNNNSAYYEDMHIAQHSGDVTVKDIICAITTHDGEQQKHYLTNTKLRHTIILNIPNLTKIAHNKPVVVFIYNTGWNTGSETGSEHKLENYKPQQTVCDIGIIDSMNNKQKYLFEAPLYSDDSKIFSGAAVTMVTVTQEDTNVRIIQLFENGIASSPLEIHKKCEKKYWSDFKMLEPTLESFTQPN